MWWLSNWTAGIAIVVGLYFLCDAVWQADGARGLRFNSLKCEILDKSLAEVEICKIHFKKRETVLSVQVALRQDVSNVVLRMKLMQKQSGWRPYFYDKRINVCEFLANPRKHVVPYLFFRYGRPYHNIRHKCPFNASEKLILQGIELKPEIILDNIPIDIGEYGLFSYWYIDDKLMAMFNGSMIYTDYSKIF